MYAKVYQMLYPTLETEAVMGLSEAVAAFEVDIAKLLLTFEHERSPDDVTVCVSEFTYKEAYHLTCVLGHPQTGIARRG